MEPEKRRCNECGEEWLDTGAYECPFCGSDDTFIVEEELGYRLVLFSPDGEALTAWDHVEEWDLTEDPTALLATWLYNNDIGAL